MTGMGLTSDDKTRIHGMRGEQFRLILEQLEAEHLRLLATMSESNRPFLVKGMESRRQKLLQGMDAAKQSRLRLFQVGEPIDVGALVQVRFLDERKDPVQWRWITPPTETDVPFSYEGTEIVFNRGGLGAGTLLLGHTVGACLEVPGDTCSDFDVKIEILSVL